VRLGATLLDRRYDLIERLHGAIARIAIGGAQRAPIKGRDNLMRTGGSKSQLRSMTVWLKWIGQF